MTMQEFNTLLLRDNATLKSPHISGTNANFY